MHQQLLDFSTPVPPPVVLVPEPWAEEVHAWRQKNLQAAAQLAVADERIALARSLAREMRDAWLAGKECPLRAIEGDLWSKYLFEMASSMFKNNAFDDDWKRSALKNPQSEIHNDH